MTAVWNNFYNGSKSIEYYADVITALGASTASSSEEIAKGLQKFSSIAETTGLSYEYATSALATVVATTRQSADSVGTSFKTLFSRLLSLNLGETLDDGTTLNKYSKALETVGVTIKKANGDLKDMDDILADLGTKWKSLGKDLQIALALTVGGVRNYTGLVALMDNWDKFLENLKTAQTALGTLLNLADIYAESWQAASAHVKAASETIYKNLLDDKVFKGLTNTFGSVLDIVGSITDSLGGFGGTMTGILALASRVFAPLMSNMFSNIGLNIGGRTRAIQMQELAIASLKEPVYVSLYSSVNALLNTINTNLQKNITSLRLAIETGKLPTYLLPAYNWMMNTVDRSGQEALLAAQTLEESSRSRELEALNAQARLNVAGRGRQSFYTTRYRELEKEIADTYAAGKVPSKELLQNATYYGQMSGNIFMATNPGAKSVTGAMGIIKALEDEAVRKTVLQYSLSAIKDSFNYLDERGNYSAKGIQNAIGVARTIYNGANGDLKEMTRVFGTSTAKDILSFYNATKNIGDVSKLSKDELDALGASLNEHHNIAGSLDARLVTGANKFESLMTDMTRRVRDQFGETEDNDTKTQEYMKGLRSRIQGAGFDNFLKLFTLGRYKELEKILGDEYASLLNKPATITGGEAATRVTLNFASIGTAVIAATNAIKTFGDENATTSLKASALVTTMGTMPMAITSASKLIGDFGTKIGETGLTVGGLTGIIAGATAAIAGIAIAVKETQKVSITGQIEKLNSSLSISSQLASDAKLNYEELLVGSQNYNGLLDKLDKLKLGTQEYASTLLDTNEIAQKLIDNNHLIYGEDYIFNALGAIQFLQGALDKAQKVALELREERLRGEQLIKLARNTLLYYNDNINNLSNIGANFNTKYKVDKPFSTEMQYANLNVGTILSALTKGIGNSTISGTESLLYMIASTLKKDIDFSDIDNLAALIGMTGASTYEEAMEKIRTTANYITGQEAYYGTENYTDLPEAVKFSIAAQFDPAILKLILANGLASIDLALLSLGSTIQNTDLINYALSSLEGFAQNLTLLYSIATLAGTKSLGEGRLWGEDPKAWYQLLYGKVADASYTDELIDALVQQKLIEDILLNGTEGYANLKLLTDFKSINDVLKEFQGFNLPNLENLTYDIIQSSFDSLKDKLIISPGHERYLQNAKNDSIQSYAEYAKLLFDNQIADLQDAILYSYSDSAIQALSQLVFASDSPQIVRIAHDLTEGLTYGTTKAVVNAITLANAVGQATGETMLDLLLLGKEKGYLADILEVAQNYNFDNSIASLYASNLGRKYARTEQQSQAYQALIASQIKEMELEKGFFMALYNSSGFSDVMDALNELFLKTGEITAHHVTELAEKSEVLQLALKFSADNTDKLNVNAAGIANVFNEINKGTIKASEVSSGLLSSLSIAGANEQLTEEAYNIIDNLDLGRNATELLEYFLLMGKAYFNAENAGWGFYSEPIKNIINMIGGARVKDEYRRINTQTNLNAKDAFAELPDYLTDFLYAMAGVSGKGKNKKAKGGGGPEDVFSFIYELFSDNGLEVGSEDFWGNLGFKTDSEGNFTLLDDKKLTRDILEERLADKFKEIGIDEEYAKDFATIAYAYAAASGHTGYDLDVRGAEAGYENLIEGSKERPETLKNLRAFYRSYGSLLVDSNGNPLYDGTDKDFDRFMQSYQSRGGLIGWSALNPDDWSKITSTNDLMKLVNLYLNYSSFQELAKVYGAIGTDSQGAVLWDYNKLIELIESMNGTEENLIDILLGSHFSNNVTARDKYGQVWTKKANLTWQEFANDVNNATGYEGAETRGFSLEDARKAAEAELEAAGLTGLIDYDPNTGKWTYRDLHVKGSRPGEIVEPSPTEGSETQLPEVVETFTPDNILDMNEDLATADAALTATVEASNQLLSETTDATLGEKRWQTPTVSPSEEKANEEFAETTGQAMADALTEALEGQEVDPAAVAALLLAQFELEQALQYAELLKTTAEEQMAARDAEIATLEAANIEANNLRDGTNDWIQDQGIAINNLKIQLALYERDFINYLTLISAEDRLSFLQLAAEKLQSGVQLTAFEKAVLSSLDSIDETGLLLAKLAEEAAEESGNAFVKGKQGQIDEKTGAFVDEKGNLVLPYEAPALGGGGTDYSYKPTTPEQFTQLGGGAVRNNNTGLVAVPDGKGGYTIYDDPDKIDWSLNNSSSSSSTPNAMAGDTRYTAHKASGLNNHTLTFASGKNGEIAVTGELGPELRIKEDGSADLLGKTSREYAWVEPGDKIYTANLTASILGNNNIPALEGLAKGILNYIPGYASSTPNAMYGDSRYESKSWSWGHSADWNGSSSGGDYSGSGGEEEKKDPRYDPNTLKIRDILERYYTILQQLNVIAHAVEHISKVVDRSWGQERVKAIQEQTALYLKQYDSQVKYVLEIRSYTKVDKEALTTMVREFVEGYNEGKDETDRITWNGAQFDENGVLTNYKDFVEKLVEQYNENAEENAGDKEAQYKFQELLKDILFYTESLNLLMTEEEKLYDLRNQILDNQVREVTYRIEYENELDNNLLLIINYELGKVKDNAYESAEAINLLSLKSELATKGLHRYNEGLFDILSAYTNEETINKLRDSFTNDPEKFFTEWAKYENGFRQDLTTEHALLMEADILLMIAELQELLNNFEQTVTTMGDNIKEFGKSLDSEIGKFDYYADVLKSLKNIIGLTNRSMTNIDSAFISSMNQNMLDNSMNKMAGSKRNLQSAQAWQNQVLANYNAMANKLANATDEKSKAKYQHDLDLLLKQLDTANERVQNANKEWLSSWESTLLLIQENYKEAVEEASRVFEESLSPYFKTLEMLLTSFDRLKKLSELYVQDYQRIHDLSKLNRDILQSILDTDNLKSKTRLRDLLKLINKLQEDGTELSEYDLDILDKKYKLELARQALEDAKDAKSVVRLSRDNNGNWGYAYSANADDIAEKEQAYEDALYELERANENGIKNFLDLAAATFSEMEQALANLDKKNFKTEEDRLKAILDIIDYYSLTFTFLGNQMENAFGTTDELNEYILNRFGINDHNLTKDFGETILGKMLGYDNMEDMLAQVLENAKKLGNDVANAMKDSDEQERKAWELAGYDVEKSVENVGKIFDEIADKSKEQIEIVDDMANRMDEAFTKSTKATLKLIDAIEKLVKTINEGEAQILFWTDFLKASGEYVPPEKLEFIDAIDTQKEINEIEKAFKEHGNIVVIDRDAENNERVYELTDLKKYDELMKIWKDTIYRNEAIDVGEAVDTREELNKINEYLEAHGEAYVNINGELTHLVKGTEETNKLLAEWLNYIEYLEKPSTVDTGGGDYYGNVENQWKYDVGRDGVTLLPTGQRAVDITTAYVNSNSSYSSTQAALAIAAVAAVTRGMGYLSGGYTGRWQSALTGMYTGEWPMGSVESNGRWALLHLKELVLNAHDTENFLNAMEIVRQLDNLTNWMANGLGNLVIPNVTTERESLDLNVHIEANFPNVLNHNEIEQAFENIVNLASQYANRK